MCSMDPQCVDKLKENKQSKSHGRMRLVHNYMDWYINIVDSGHYGGPLCSYWFVETEQLMNVMVGNGWLSQYF